jgi:RNA polymerase sigma factor (sigma-70 family)
MNQKLVEDNMNLVYFLINRYYPTFIQDEDLAQCGMIGLCKAADKFDETKGITFSTFAASCILNEFCKEFTRRKRHNGVVSLEYNLFNDDGETTTIGNFIVGEDDVDYVDDENFYKKLSPMDREIVELRKFGYSSREISKKFNVSEQLISQHLIKMRHTWRKMYGN